MAKNPWELDYASEEIASPTPGDAKPWELSYNIGTKSVTEKPSEKMRSVAQGLTFGGADEVEAYLRSMSGEDYDAALNDVRSKLKAYRAESPIEAGMYELAGAAIPATAGTIMTGGAGFATMFPNLARLPAVARMSLLGAAGGGATSFLSAEGDIGDRLRSVPVGAGVGAITGPGAYYGVKAGGATVDAIMDFARRRIGGRGAKVVETELQRIAGESGLTVDEIVDRIANGEIMAENETLRAAVRGYYAQGGTASNILGKVMTERPTKLRSQLMSNIKEGLAPGMDRNVLRSYRAGQEGAKKAEAALYEEAYGKGGVVSKPLLDEFEKTLRRSPEARNTIDELFLAETGKRPFYDILPDGTIQYKRAPTIEEMEIARRGLKQTVNTMYQSGKGSTGAALGNIETALRAEIDAASPAVAKARAQAAANFSANEAFAEGRSVFAKSADEVQIMVEKMSPAQLKAFRAGVMDAIRRKNASGGRQTMAKNLADEETKDGQILRSVFPQDKLDEVLQLAKTTARSQQAARTVLGGSPTAANLAQMSRQGMNVSADEFLSAVSGNPMAAVRIASKTIQQMTPNLTDAQRARVAQVLVSEDPALVRSALMDNSMMAKVQQKVNQIVERFAVGASGASSYFPASRVQGGGSQ